MSFRVHAFVKNTDDYQFVFCFTIKDDMLANPVGTQVLTDIIPWRTQAGSILDRFEAVPDLA